MGHAEIANSDAAAPMKCAYICLSMNAYLCTYRQRPPRPIDLAKTRNAGKDDPLVEKFLSEYDDGHYDWGDDPAFFAAKHKLRNVRKASWGVCRPDVRTVSEPGDVVVFFCAHPNKERTIWTYSFIGFGTVGERIWHMDVWKNRRYAPYRSFYNLLINKHEQQEEIFWPIHTNWKRRLESPYIIFDAAKSVFNLDSPHVVAEWHKGDKKEIWKLDRRTKKIERVLFAERGIDRRLRTSQTGYAHTKLNLLQDGRNVRPGRSLPELLKVLKELAF